MILKRVLAVAAAISLATVFGSAAAKADVAFGNLGASGTNALSTTSTDITPTYRLAVPFTTGSSSSFLKLESITVGLFYDNFETSSFGLSIYANNSGVPSSTIAATAPAQTIGTAGRYTFSFSNFQMAANTTYWIRPAVDLSWYAPLTSPTPVAYNASGFSWSGTGLASSDGGSTWNTDDLVVNNGRYAFSVQAVPEPSTYAMAAVAAGLFGWARFSRRRAAPAAGR